MRRGTKYKKAQNAEKFGVGLKIFRTNFERHDICEAAHIQQRIVQVAFINCLQIAIVFLSRFFACADIFPKQTVSFVYISYEYSRNVCFFLLGRIALRHLPITLI